MAGRQTASFGCDFCTLCAGSHCLTGLWTLSGYFLAKRLLALGKRHVLGSESVCSPQTLDTYIYIYMSPLKLRWSRKIARAPCSVKEATRKASTWMALSKRNCELVLIAESEAPPQLLRERGETPSTTSQLQRLHRSLSLEEMGSYNTSMTSR